MINNGSNALINLKATRLSTFNSPSCCKFFKICATPKFWWLLFDMVNHWSSNIESLFCFYFLLSQYQSLLSPRISFWWMLLDGTHAVWWALWGRGWGSRVRLLNDDKTHITQDHTYMPVFKECVREHAHETCARQWMSVLLLQLCARVRGCAVWEVKPVLLGSSPVSVQSEQWDRQRLPPPAARLGAAAEWGPRKRKEKKRWWDAVLEKRRVGGGGGT